MMCAPTIVLAPVLNVCVCRHRKKPEKNMKDGIDRKGSHVFAWRQLVTEQRTINTLSIVAWRDRTARARVRKGLMSTHFSSASTDVISLPVNATSIAEQTSGFSAFSPRKYWPPTRHRFAAHSPAYGLLHTTSHSRAQLSGRRPPEPPDPSPPPPLRP